MFNFLLDGNEGSGIVVVVYALMFAVLGYFLINSFRSKKKEQQEYTEMKNSLAVGDEVTTIGGIIGKVISIKDETFVLETTKDRTKIRFLKGAIRSVDVKIADVIAAQNAEKAEAEAAEKATAEPEKVAEATEATEAPAKKKNKKK